jgi:hypothetical protein
VQPTTQVVSRETRETTGETPVPPTVSAGTGSGSPVLRQAARRLPEPFTVESLMVESGVENRKTCANAITIWAGKGWVKRVSPGEYERTRSFASD